MVNDSINKTSNKAKRNYILLLIVTIFYSATYSSSLWVSVFPQAVFSYIRYGLLGLMTVVFLYHFLLVSRTRKQWGIALCLLIFLIYNFLFQYGSLLAPLIVFCAYMSFLNQREIIYSYALGLSLTVFFVVLMSLMRILPTVMDSGFLTYGFGNPNSIGGILAVVFMSYLYLSWQKSNILFLSLYVAIIAINNFVFEDNSASICMIIYLFFYLIRKRFTGYQVVGIIGVCLPTILTIASLFLAYFYGKYKWINDIDEMLTRRIYTWNYYLSLNGLHLIPHSMGIIKANEYQLGFLGFYEKSIDPLLRGFFDGGYMFLLLRAGIIDTILVLSVLAGYFYKLAKNNKISLEILLLIFLVYTFSENEWIAPYGFCVSYLLPICFSKDQEI